MKMEKSQTYTPEFRESSVKLALDSDQSIKQTAEAFLWFWEEKTEENFTFSKCQN